MAYTKASAQFHSAVVSNSPVERALIVFGDDFFNDSDIDVNSGLTFTDYFNPDEELMVGSTPSSTLNVTIINDAGLLDGLSWTREFKAMLGVQTITEPYTTSYTADLFAWVNAGVTVQAYSTSPYLKCNGVAVASQPSSAVVGLWIYENLMYAIASDGTATKYKLNGTTWTKQTSYSQSSFMVEKFKTLIGRSLTFQDNKMREFTYNSNTPATWSSLASSTWDDVSTRTWGSFGNITAQVTEYVPLGYFTASKPKVLSSATVNVEAYDRMVKLDKIADTWFNNLAYPKSINDIITAFCTRYGLTLENSLYSDPIPNGSLTFASRPATLENVTAREVLSYLAEITGTMAHFTRDGKLKFDWFKTNSLTIPWIFSQTEYSYSVPNVTGIVIQTSDNESGVIYGTDDNPYIITDNLFTPTSLSDATLLTIAQNIYTQLITMPVFPPSNVSITSDWSIEGGDIVTANGVTTPVYVQTVTYNGGALATLENSGEEVRPVDSQVSREGFTQKAAVATIQAEIGGIIAATDNNKLVFDENGLHIQNGGFDILNAASERVLYADNSGNLSITGGFTSVKRYEIDNNGITEYWWVRSRLTDGGLECETYYTEDANDIPGTDSNWVRRGYFDWSFLYGNLVISAFASMMTCDELRVYSEASVGYLVTDEQISVGSDIYFHPSMLTTGTNLIAVDNGDGFYSIYPSSSSRKYKKNIDYIDAKSDAIIDALKPVTYEDKSSDSGTKYYGFIAEDVEKVAPMLVQHNAKGEPESLMYDRITVLLADDNRKLRKRVDELEARIAKLEELITSR